LRRFSTLFGLLIFTTLLGSVPAAAQNNYTFLVSALGGAGGAFDLTPDTGTGNSALELGAALVTDLNTLASIRVGRIRFSSDRGFGALSKANLDYVVVAGEYRFAKPSYDVGMFFGLGGYRTSGTDIAAVRHQDQALGLAFGVTGQFRLAQHFSLLGELEAHYAFLEDAHLLGVGLIGLGFHF